MAQIYSQPETTNTGSDVRTKVVFAIERLRDKSPEPVSFADLTAYLFSEGLRNEPRQMDLFRRFLRLNDKVAHDPATDSYKYRAVYQISSADELLAYLQSQDHAGGLSVRDLKDGWPDVVATIDRLESEHRLIADRHKKDNTPKHVYQDDPTLYSTVDDEFRLLWSEIPVPSHAEMQTALRAEGFKTAGDVVVLHKPVKKVEKNKKKSRSGTKTTNTHMQHVFRDYSGQRPAAKT